MTNPDSLKDRTVKGFTWSFIDLVARQGFQLIIQITLARLLLPEHFGVLGMIVIFIALSNSIVDSGFSQALIRNQRATQTDYSTVFIFNLFIALFIYILLYFTSPLISTFFKEPQLVVIIRVIAVVLIINALGIIQSVKMTKKMDFKTQAKINVIAVISSGVVTITMAFLGYGVWSLVVNSISMQAVQTFLLWVYGKWVPSIVFNQASFKKHFNFGYKLLLSGLLDTFYNNLFHIIIGRFHTTAQLGYYTNAVRFRDQASHSITASIQRVSYPLLSSLQNDEEKLRMGFKKVLRMSAFINFPLMLGLVAIANPLFTLLLGDKWLSSIVYFQLLCVAGMLYPMHAVNLNILQVKGRSDLFLKLEVIKKGLLTVLITISIMLELGVIGLIVAAVVNSFLSLLINTYYSAREVNYSTRTQLLDLLPSFSTALVMGSVVYLVGMLAPVGELTKIILQIVVGICLYIIISKVLKIPELEELSHLILQFVSKIKHPLYSSNR